MAKIGELTVVINGETYELDKALKQSTEKVNDFSTTATKALGSLGIAAGVAAVAMKGIEFNKAAESAKVAFTVMTGSAETAEKTLKSLKDYANKTPLEFKDIRQATQTLVQFGFGADEATKMIKKLGDVSGGDAQKLQALSTAMGQINSTGRLMGQDLNQLINAGFNPLLEISKHTGRSMADLKKDMEQGAISADMVKESFTRATSEGGQFFGMLEKQADTVSGKMSTMNDAIDTAAGSLMESFTPAIKALTDIVTGLATGFAELPAGVQAFAGSLVLAAGAAAALSTAATFLGVSLAPLAPYIGVIAGVAVGLAGLIGLFTAIDKHNTDRLNREYGSLAEQLGVTVKEAERLSILSEQLGKSVEETKELSASLKDVDVYDVADSFSQALSWVEKIDETTGEVVNTTDDLRAAVYETALKYGISATQALKIAEATGATARFSKDVVDGLKQEVKLREASWKYMTAAEKAAANQKEWNDAAKKAFAEITAMEKKAAEDKAAADKKAAEKAAEERAKKREELKKEIAEYFASEQDKLKAKFEADKKILQSGKYTKEQLTALEKKYAEDTTALAIAEGKKQNEGKLNLEKDYANQLKTIHNEQFENLKIKNDEQLAALKKRLQEEVDAGKMSQEEMNKIYSKYAKENSENTKSIYKKTGDIVAAELSKINSGFGQFAKGIGNIAADIAEGVEFTFENFGDKITNVIAGLVTGVMSMIKDSIRASSNSAMEEIDNVLNKKLEAEGIAEDSAQEALEKELERLYALRDGKVTVEQDLTAALDAETQARLEAEWLADQTEIEKLNEKLAAAKEAEDIALIEELEREIKKQTIIEEGEKKKKKLAEDALIKEKEDELARIKLTKEAEKEKANIKYKADLAAHNINIAMAIAQAAQAIVVGFAQLGPIGGAIAAAVTAGITAAQISIMANNAPKPPALWTGTTNPIGEAGSYLVGDQGPEIVNLPKGATVMNNRDTMNELGGQKGPIRATIQMIMDGRTIAENTVDLINNGLVRLELA